MVYTHVRYGGSASARSPLDRLECAGEQTA
jgi:hypothetical protein